MEKFNEILTDCPGYTLVSFSGTNFDHRVIEEAMQRHKIDTDVFLSHSHVDLSILLRRCFIFPNQRFALKELGKFLGYPFAHPDLDGLAVALSYHKHAEDGKPLDPKIFRYNEDDVRSLPFLIDKVTKGELKITKIFVSNQTGIDQTEKKVARDQEFKIASNNIEDYKCPKCGHFYSSNFIKRKLPKQCYRCRYKFNEKRTH